MHRVRRRDAAGGQLLGQKDRRLRKSGILGTGGTIALAACGTWQGGPVPGLTGGQPCAADDVIALIPE